MFAAPRLPPATKAAPALRLLSLKEVAMKRIENTPDRLVYSKTYRGKEGSQVIPGQFLEYPLVVLLNAIGVVLVLALIPALDYPRNVIVGGASAGWVLASLWMIYREGWKTQLRKENLVVDKATQELQRVYIYRSGKQRIHRKTRDQMHTLIPKNEQSCYWVILDATTAAVGRWRWHLASFTTADERDALLHELADALQLPVAPEE